METDIEQVKRKRGRKPMGDSTNTAYIGFKASDELDGNLKDAVDTLKQLGFSDVDKSKLARALIEYRISNAVIIYRESMLKR